MIPVHSGRVPIARATTAESVVDAYLPRLAGGLVRRPLRRSSRGADGARRTGRSTLAESERFVGYRLYLNPGRPGDSGGGGPGHPRSGLERGAGDGGRGAGRARSALLELVRLPPYWVNRGKRLVKGPKLYWSDPALVVWLSGAGAASGEDLENLVLDELLVWRDGQAPGPERPGRATHPASPSASRRTCVPAPPRRWSVTSSSAGLATICADSGRPSADRLGGTAAAGKPKG